MSMERLVHALAVTVLLSAIVGCQTKKYTYVKPVVSKELPGQEQVSLFNSKEVGPYLRKKIALPGGDCEVALDVVAKKAGGAGDEQPVGAWLQLEFYRKGKLFSKISRNPSVTATSKTYSDCYARVPNGCDEIQIGIGADEQSATFFAVESVRLFMQRPTAHSLTPAIEAEVADNTPVLSWKSTSSQVMVDVSKDKTFPEGATTTQTVVGERSFQVEKPLEKGPWYWRVRTDAGFVSEPQIFIVTVPTSQDTTPPTVVIDHMHMKDKTTPVSFKIDKDLVKRVTAEVDGLACMVTTDSEMMVNIVPENGWKSGLNKLELKVYDFVGNVGRQHIYVTYRTEPIKTVDWTKDFGIHIEGEEERILPLGVYAATQYELTDAKQAGFTIVQNFEADNAAFPIARIWLDAVQYNGLKAILAVNSKDLYSMDLHAVADRVAKLMYHPALVGWYLCDEPDHPERSIAPYKLKAAYQLIKKLDPYHPVLLSCKNATLIEDYAGSYDVYLTKTTEKDPAAFQQKAQDIREFLGEFKTKGTLALQNDVPTMDPTTLRMRAYLALMQQNGLFVNQWLDEKTLEKMVEAGDLDNLLPKFQAADSPKALKAAILTETESLLKEITANKIVFLRDGAIDRFKTNDVYGYVKTTRREIYMVLVCVGDNGKVTYRLSDRGDSKQLTKDEPVSLLVKDQNVTVELKKGQVFILEVR